MCVYHHFSRRLLRRNHPTRPLWHQIWPSSNPFFTWQSECYSSASIHPCSLMFQSCSKAYTAPKASYWAIPLCLPSTGNALLSSARQSNFVNKLKLHSYKTSLFPPPPRGSDPSIFCPQRYNYKHSIIFMLLWVIRQSSCLMGQPFSTSITSGMQQVFKNHSLDG